jgi:RHS repeat-associated protein
VASIVQGSTTIGLSYDDSHARVVQTGPAGTTSYLNDPVSGAMSEKLVSGGTTSWHDYLQIDGQIAAERFCTGAAPCGTGATMRYFVRDHLGSVAAVTDDTGTVVERDAYDAWGRRRNINGSDDPACSLTSQTTRGYTGQEMMDAVCQVNANARVYDATLGRFTSVDPMLNVYDGQNLNGYGYVGNNPLSMTDPSGMDDCLPDPNPQIEAVCVTAKPDTSTLTSPTITPTFDPNDLAPPEPAIVPPISSFPTGGGGGKPKPTKPNTKPCPSGVLADIARWNITHGEKTEKAGQYVMLDALGVMGLAVEARNPVVLGYGAVGFMVGKTVSLGGSIARTQGAITLLLMGDARPAIQNMMDRATGDMTPPGTLVGPNVGDTVSQTLGAAVAAKLENAPVCPQD